MDDRELVIAIRLWFGRHDQGCEACKADGCDLAQRAEQLALDLGAEDVSPLEPRS